MARRFDKYRMESMAGADRSEPIALFQSRFVTGKHLFQSSDFSGVDMGQSPHITHAPKRRLATKQIKRCNGINRCDPFRRVGTISTKPSGIRRTTVLTSSTN